MDSKISLIKKLKENSQLFFLPYGSFLGGEATDGRNLIFFEPPYCIHTKQNFSCNNKNVLLGIHENLVESNKFSLSEISFFIESTKHSDLGHVIVYHRCNFFSHNFLRKFLIFQNNNCAQTFFSMLSTSGHYYFFLIKNYGKIRWKLNYSYSKVSPALKAFRFYYFKYGGKISINQFLRCANVRLSKND